MQTVACGIITVVTQNMRINVAYEFPGLFGRCVWNQYSISSLTEHYTPPSWTYLLEVFRFTAGFVLKQLP